MKNIDLSAKSLFNNLESHTNFLDRSFDQFDNIWLIQGKIYWLRYLIALREHYLEKLTKAMYPSLNDICIEQFLRDVDKCFVLIHKKFIESNQHSAKSFIFDVIRLLVCPNKFKYSVISNIIREKPWPRELCQSLTRVSIPYNEKSFFREYDILKIYHLFYLSLSFIDSKFVDAIDLPENFDDNFSVPYWLPLPKWTDKEFKPGFFDRYLSHFWKDKLPKLLLTPNVHNIFARKVNHMCYPLPGGTRNRYFLEFLCVTCSCKESCRKVILHSEDCINPYLCFGSAKCKMSCESSMKKQEVTYEKEHSGAWKCFQCFTYKSKRDNCRDVATQAQKMPFPVFTFIHEMNRSVNDVSSIFHLVKKHSTCHSNSKQQMRSRLLSKLTKRQKESAAQYDNTTNNMSLFKDPHYQLTLYRKAKRKFDEELKTRVPYTVDTWLTEARRFPLSRYNIENRSSEASSYQSSIGTGYELLTNFKVVESKVKTTAMSSTQSKLNKQVPRIPGCIQNGGDKPSDCFYSGETNQHKEMRREGCGNDLTVDDEPSYSKMVEKETSLVHKINALQIKKLAPERKIKSSEDICEKFRSFIRPTDGKLFLKRDTKVPMIKKFEKTKSRELRICAYCMTQEEKIRSFLKCSLCKKGNFKEQRYYCSKNCQSDDWRKCHRDEHKNNFLE